MIVKPYGKKQRKEVWYRFKKSEDPDKLLLKFLKSQGEFSAMAELSFLKTLSKNYEYKHLLTK